MPPGPVPGAPASRPRTSGALKVLLGCGVVLGVLFFGSCLAVGGVGIYFITTPGQIEPEVLLGERTLAVVQVHGDLEDEGVRSLMEAFFDAMERMQSEAADLAEMPAALQAIQQMGNNSNRQNLRWLFPVEGIVVVESRAAAAGRKPEDLEDPEVLGAINLNHLPRVYARSLDWISAIDEGASEEFTEHAGHTIAAGDEGAFSLVGGTVLIATSLEQMITALDRIEAAGSGGAPAEGEALRDALARLEGRGDAELVVNLETEEMKLLAREILAERGEALTGGSTALGECQRLEGWLDLVDADTLLLHLELRCSRDPFGWDIWLELVAEGLREVAQEEGLDFEHETREAEGAEPGVILDAEITGLEALVNSAFDPPEADPEEMLGANQELLDALEALEALESEEAPGRGDRIDPR